MSKKTEFHNRLSRGLDPDRAAELSGITSRKVKFKYRKEWEAVQSAQAAEAALEAAPPPPTLASHLQEYWDSRKHHFRRCFDHLPVPELSDLLQSCRDNEGNPDWRNEALPEPRTATIIPPAQDYPLEVSQTLLEAKSTKKAENDENRPSEINNLQTVQIDVIPSSEPIAPSVSPDVRRLELQFSTATGDPYGRELHQGGITNTSEYWFAERVRQEEAAAAKRWAEGIRS